MNMFKKCLFSIVATLAVVSPAAASPSLLVALPDISVLTTEVGVWIADEWQALRSVLLSVPRVVRADRQAAVMIFEGPNHMIVVATRLAPAVEAADALTLRSSR